jgi:ribokinase
MTFEPEIVVVGSHAPGLFLRVKRPPIAGETVIGWDYSEPVDGGKGSNQAIAAARLGARVSFVGCLGNDRLGNQGRVWMEQAGVDTRFIRRSDSATGVGFILLDEQGVPAMVTCLGANEELTLEEVHTALEQLNGKILLTQFEIPLKVAIETARLAREKGMLTIVNPAPAAELPLDDLKVADILVPNESEARQLLGVTAAEEMDDLELANRLRGQTGAGSVVITLGGRGVVGSDSQGNWSVEAPLVQVADTSGAGDTFCAALACGLARGRDLRDATAWACRVAALSVMRPGTIPAFPTLAEVEAFSLSRTAEN